MNSPIKQAGMTYYYRKYLQQAALALSFIFVAGFAPAAYAAPLHDASSNILGAVKDKSAAGKKSDDADSGAADSGQPEKPAPEKQPAEPAPQKDPDQAHLDKAAAQSSFRPRIMKIAASGRDVPRAHAGAASKRQRNHFGAAKRAAILGSAAAPANSAHYPQAKIISYQPSAISGQRPYSSLIHHLALKYDMPEDLIHAVVYTESNYNYRLRGSVGEVGLMQIRPATARMLGYSGTVRGLYSPDVNLEYGTRYLALARYLSGGSLCGTVLKYNAGHGAKRMNPVSYRYCKNVKSYLYSVGYRY